MTELTKEQELQDIELLLTIEKQEISLTDFLENLKNNHTKELNQLNQTLSNNMNEVIKELKHNHTEELKQFKQTSSDNMDKIVTQLNDKHIEELKQLNDTMSANMNNTTNQLKNAYLETLNLINMDLSIHKNITAILKSLLPTKYDYLAKNFDALIQSAFYNKSYMDKPGLIRQKDLCQQYATKCEKVWSGETNAPGLIKYCGLVQSGDCDIYDLVN